MVGPAITPYRDSGNTVRPPHLVRPRQPRFAGASSSCSATFRSSSVASSVFLTQPCQFRPLILTQRLIALSTAALVSIDPVAQRAFVDAQTAGGLHDRFSGLPGQPYCAS